MQFWPPDYERMGSKHVEAWNKLIVKQKFCASSWLITEINILRCTVSKTQKNEPDIVEDIKIRRLGWAGHIIRREEERIKKKKLSGNSYTTKPGGRPRTRRADVACRRVNFTLPSPLHVNHVSFSHLVYIWLFYRVSLRFVGLLASIRFRETRYKRHIWKICHLYTVSSLRYQQWILPERVVANFEGGGVSG